LPTGEVQRKKTKPQPIPQKKQIKFIVNERSKRMKEFKSLLQEGIDLMAIVLKNTHGYYGDIDYIGGMQEDNFKIPAILTNPKYKLHFGDGMRRGTQGTVFLDFSYATRMYIEYGTQQDQVTGEVLMRTERGKVTYYEIQFVNGKFMWNPKNLDRFQELRSDIQIARNKVRKGEKEPTQTEIRNLYDDLNRFKNPIIYIDNLEFYFKHRLAIAHEVLNGNLSFQNLNY